MTLSVAFPPVVGPSGLGFVEFCTGCLWVFSFQWLSRDDEEEEAESEGLDFVIDLLVSPGKLTAVPRVFICKF